MKTIQPFGDRLLVKVIEPRQQTASGIYLPDNSREGPREGEVIAIGEGSTLADKLAIGDVVLYQKFAGNEVKLEDGSFVLLAEQDILGRAVEVDPLRPPTASASLEREVSA